MNPYPYKFTLEEIRQDPTVQRLLARRTLAAETQRFYVKGVRVFCEYFEKKPSELIDHFKGLSPDEIVEEFSEWFVAVKDSLASKSVWAWLPGIKGWLLENGVREVDRVSRDIAREFKRKIGRVRTLLKRDVMTKEEIRRVLTACLSRERAIISLMASSGLRVGAALNLQLKHFRDDMWNPELPCFSLEIPEKLSKDGEPYLTFITGEAAEYTRNMLLERRNEGEELRPDSYVFTTHRGNNPLSRKRFGSIWRKMCDQAGLDMKPVPIKGYHPVGKKGGGVRLEENSNRYNTRVHSLRKFFKTACSISGVDRMASESFMGHSLTKFGIESLYDFCVGKEKWLKEEYMKVIPAVTFLKPLPSLPAHNGEARRRILELEEKLVEVEKQNLEMRERITFISKKENALERLLKRVEDLEKRLTEK